MPVLRIRTTAAWISLHRIVDHLGMVYRQFGHCRAQRHLDGHTIAAARCSTTANRASPAQVAQALTSNPLNKVTARAPLYAALCRLYRRGSSPTATPTTVLTAAGPPTLTPTSTPGATPGATPLRRNAAAALAGTCSVGLEGAKGFSRPTRVTLCAAPAAGFADDGSGQLLLVAGRCWQ
jgi:hypothetical protein